MLSKDAPAKHSRTCWGGSAPAPASSAQYAEDAHGWHTKDDSFTPMPRSPPYSCCLARNQDCSQLAAGHITGTIVVWDRAGRVCCVLRHRNEWGHSESNSNQVTCLGFLSGNVGEEGHWLVAGYVSGALSIWDCVDRICAKSITAHRGALFMVE